MALVLGSCSDGATPAKTDTSNRATPHATVPPQAVNPRSAFAFDDSIGVDTHPTYFSTVHGNEDAIAQKIAEAGIHNVRNGMAISDNDGWNRAAWANMAAWPRHGVVSSWGVDRCSVSGGGHTLREYLDKIAEIDRNLSSAIEGTNEVNKYCGHDWVPRERSYVAALDRAVKHYPDPGIRSLPVIGPSFSDDRALRQIGNIGRWIDYRNTHPYSGCTSPTPEHVLRYGIRSYAPAAPSKPVIATEVGFHTAVNTTDPGAQPPCDERTAGVYTLRTVLEHFNLGIKRSYIYEAIDLEPDPGKAEPNDNFGILRNDLTPKPAYSSLKNLLATTRSTDSVDLAPLQLAVEQRPDDLRTLLLRRSDGAYVLALWRNASVWDREARRELPVEPSPVTLDVPTVKTAYEVVPSRSADRTPVAVRAGRLTVSLGADALLLVLR